MADAVSTSGGVVAAAREQGHVEATGETRLVPGGNGRSKVGRITGSTGKAVEDERESDGHIVCAGQRTDQEGWNPSGARMRGAISESGGNASLAVECEHGEP